MKSINLLPPTTVKRAGRALIIVLIAAFIVTMGAQLYGYLRWNSQTELMKIKLQQIIIEAERVRDEGIPRSEYDAYQQALNLLNQLQSTRKDWMPYLEAVVSPIGKDVRVKSIALSNESSISLEMDFPTFETSLAYVKALESDPVLKNIRLKSYSKQIDEETESQTGSDGQSTVKQVNKEIFKVIINMELTEQKGAEANGAK
ncbi:PilN domain-containing protein [Paenibacillus soyae]|uniref:Fimbrial assembly protein n=1 Tax=Paenibacillus soyae TaxID=2969249 RepID=A0A9X2MQQ6_9BACL|nr:hypothetical protein [Paenibacillus soyae]MCR2806518.1 hypothetical protein [Paenibacillus soyae]